MKLNSYEIRSSEENLSFEFVSVGTKGFITKLIQFTLINEAGYYNLAFGDKDLTTGEIDDLATTDNGDTEKVLATVVAAVYIFCSSYPYAWIYATGSTTARTRLYRMGINKHFETAHNDFEIFGEKENSWERFRSNESYKAFLVQLKKRKFE